MYIVECDDSFCAKIFKQYMCTYQICLVVLCEVQLTNFTVLILQLQFCLQLMLMQVNGEGFYVFFIKYDEKCFAIFANIFLLSLFLSLRRQQELTLQYRFLRNKQSNVCIDFEGIIITIVVHRMFQVPLIYTYIYYTRVVVTF